MTKHLISQPIEPATVLAPQACAGGHLEPQLPPEFRWHGETLEVKGLVKTWRTTKEDRGDVYLKKHWFEFETADGRHVVVYYDRGAKRGQPRWWLHSIES